MHTRCRLLSVGLVVVLLSSVVVLPQSRLRAETVKDREGAVRKDAASMKKNDRWLYNEIDAGFAEAAKTGKPLMVVLRCVPCLACMGIDTEVLTENPSLTPLLDQFVRVRVINANSLDLSLFQFDYDLSFSVLFFHPDRTIYGRFGSWEHQRDNQKRSTDGLKFAMERVLALHAGKEKYASALAGKKGGVLSYQRPVDMPTLKNKYQADLNWSGKVVQSCVHCHQIGDAMRVDFRNHNLAIPQKWIAPYPSAEGLGLILKDFPPTSVDRVEPGSIAEKAGFLRNDEIQFLEKQPLVSVADITWVLHNAPDQGGISAKIRRGNQEENLTIELPEGWRYEYDSSRRVAIWPMRGMALGGMKLASLEDDEKSRLGIEPGKLALRATHVGKFGKHAAAMKAGFQVDDVIVSIDGKDEDMNEIKMIANNLNHRAGEKLKVEVIRRKKRITLELPIQ